MSPYVAALDQGTTSTRCMIFDDSGSVVASHAQEHRQLLPRPGWVEHDPMEIWANSLAVMAAALEKSGLRAGNIDALGIANQRETTIVWDRRTGEPMTNAIVWQDTRTQALCDALAGRGGGVDRYRSTTGLPIATYFAGPKIAWVLDNVDDARQAAVRGQLLCGTVDTWLIWNLTGGADTGLHRTDVTNASRTLLMDLRSLQWNRDIVAELGIPYAMLPEIAPSAQLYGECSAGALRGVPIAGVLGDQQAATFGQVCFDEGTAKNTYGTGNFLLLNTGAHPITSHSGLLTTVCYQINGQAPVYALEGSIAVTGSLVQWLRDNLGLIQSAADIEELAGSVDDNGGAYFVPAFSGLFAPYWRPDARGALVGLTRYVNRGHLARAVLEATAFQTRDVVDAMRLDTDVELAELKVDGGMVGNELLMQFQADLLNVDVVRPEVTETTALGAAYAAGLTAGCWPGLRELRDNWREGRRWSPRLDQASRQGLVRSWEKAVSKALGWVDSNGT